MTRLLILFAIVLGTTTANGDQRDRKQILSRKNLRLEKTTYTFTRHFMEGTQEWNLVLTPGAATKRDLIGNASAFPRSYLYVLGARMEWQQF